MPHPKQAERKALYELEHYVGNARGCSELGEAALEWFQEQPPEIKAAVAAWVVWIQGEIKRRNPRAVFGSCSALEMLGALIVLRKGWLKYALRHHPRD